jgi:hypothetical protein
VAEVICLHWWRLDAVLLVVLVLVLLCLKWTSDGEP